MITLSQAKTILTGQVAMLNPLLLLVGLTTVLAKIPGIAIAGLHLQGHLQIITKAQIPGLLGFQGLFLLVQGLQLR